MHCEDISIDIVVIRNGILSYIGGYSEFLAELL